MVNGFGRYDGAMVSWTYLEININLSSFIICKNGPIITRFNIIC